MSGDYSIPVSLSVNAAVDLLNRALVERTMAAFWVMYDQTWTAKVASHAGAEHNSYFNSGSISNSTSAKLAENNVSSTTNRKRSRESDDGSTSDGDDNGSEHPRPNPGKRQAKENQLRQACPFRKHDPSKFSLHDYPICALSSWNTISRVKYVHVLCLLSPSPTPYIDQFKLWCYSSLLYMNIPTDLFREHLN